MDFLTEHRAIIDFRSTLMTLLKDETIPSNTAQEHHIALNILDEEMNGPPRSSVIVPVGSRSIKITEGIFEGNTQPLLDGVLGIARGIAHFQNGQAQILVTNFNEEYPLLNTGTAIASLNQLVYIQNVIAISDQSADGRPLKTTLPPST